MTKIFYDYLIVREEIDIELNSFILDPEEKEELIELVDQTLHHHTLNTIFTHLPEAHHEDFIKKFHSNPADEKLINFLKEKIEINIETEIKSAVAKAKKDILSDIRSHCHKK